MQYAIVKEKLSKLGRYIPPSFIHLANGTLNYLYTGRWMHDQGFSVPSRLSHREDLYRLIARDLQEPANYLEFGVFNGASIRFWSQLLEHPETRLDGFDSFEGLPENWGMKCPKDTFDVKGQIPIINDPRVRFFKGWFQDTLPGYLKTLTPHSSIIVHLDADLYSSTAYVLQQLRPFLRPGMIMIFDEFADREHELKAFAEYLADTKIQVECIGATQALTQVAFRIKTAP